LSELNRTRFRIEHVQITAQSFSALRFQFLRSICAYWVKASEEEHEIGLS
jgi:hypothetical protein